MKKSLKGTLAKNVQLLAERKWGVRFQPQLIKAGIKNGTVTRLLKGETSVGLDTLEDLSKVFGVSVCELLCPDLNPDDPMVCMPKSKADNAKAGEILAEALAKIQAATR